MIEKQAVRLGLVVSTRGATELAYSPYMTATLRAPRTSPPAPAAGNEVPHFLLHCLNGSFDGKCSPAGAGTEMQASLLGNLPVELLHNIVTKLPPSSLARFRAVAKQWRYLLSTPEAKKLLRVALPVCALEYRPTAPDEWYPPLPWRANAERNPSILTSCIGREGHSGHKA